VKDDARHYYQQLQNTVLRLVILKSKPPPHQENSTSFIHFTKLQHMTFCKYLCSSNSTTGMLPLLYFQTLHYFCYFLLRNYPSGTTGGKDQEV